MAHLSLTNARASTKFNLALSVVLMCCILLLSCNRNNDNKTGPDFSNAVNKQQEMNTGILHPCHWSFTVIQNAPGEATLVSTAKIDSGWHLYSQYISEKGSPTVFLYNPLPGYKLTGGTGEGVSHKDYDPYLHIDIFYFEHEAVFRQKIKVLSKQDLIITGTINHTACLNQCVTRDEDFSFKVRGNP
jgi:thiol:disulfide interchange protein DsbD